MTSPGWKAKARQPFPSPAADGVVLLLRGRHRKGRAQASGIGVVSPPPLSGAQICLSSTWRSSRATINKVNAALQCWGVPKVAFCTPEGGRRKRCPQSPQPEIVGHIFAKKKQVSRSFGQNNEPLKASVCNNAEQKSLVINIKAISGTVPHFPPPMPSCFRSEEILAWLRTQPEVTHHQALPEKLLWVGGRGDWRVCSDEVALMRGRAFSLATPCSLHSAGRHRHVG